MDMEDTSKLKIFTGTAHLALAQEISDYIGEAWHMVSFNEIRCV